MKIKHTVFATITSLCLFAISTQASLLIQDNFDGYSTGPLPTNNPSLSPWLGISGTPANGASGGIQVVSDPTGNSANALQVNQTLTQDIQARLATTNMNTALADVIVTNMTFTTNGMIITTNVSYNYGFSPSNSVYALYMSMQIDVTSVPAVASGSETYFTHFSSDAAGFKARLFIVTNGAASGKYRVAIQNGGTAVTNTIPMDLNPNQAYTIVSRFILSSGASMVWLNPVNESSGNNATPLDALGTAVINAYGIRQNTGEGIVDVDNFMVGTTFADVVPGSMNAPIFVTQPQDTNVFSGASAVFNSLALGDTNITYKWFYNTNTLLTDSASVIGSHSNVLVLTGLTVGQTGTYSCVASNAVGTNLTRFAMLTVSPQPIPPSITNQPVSVTATIGDTVSLTVGATGLPVPAYQWKQVTNNGVILITNNVAGSNVTGTNTATLTFTGILPSQAGTYFCTLTNIAGYMTTNSALAAITLNPIPSLSIAQVRSMVDPTTYANTNGTSLFTVEGIVTTWTNMTSAASPEFYIQDSSGGIAVFWSGAGNSNTPPAGALVKVTAPFEFPIFDGLLTLEPVFTNTLESVTIISTNNPLPAPQPLPFDSNIQNNYPVMQQLVGSYFVASNVMLNLSTPTFSANANDPTTNQARHVRSDVSDAYNITFTNDVGQTFILFVNSHTDVTGQTKPTGPVTIYGVLGQFVSGGGPYVGGYEFTPSRFEDIISYNHITNIVTNIKHFGDLPTNSYSENVLRSGETMTSYIDIGDPEGGTVTLTPSNAGLPTGANWDGVTSGSTASAVFHYNGTNVDAGNNYTMNIGVSSTSGSSSTYSFTVYVPSADEQKIAVSEFLANPTTNTLAANFNPLHRSSGVAGVITNDEFIELANQSPDDVNLNGWGIYNGNGLVEDFSLNGPTLSSSNAAIVYGGPADGSDAPNLTVYNEQSTAKSLSLATSGTGTIILRNGNGHIVDRVVYSANDLNTNGSLTRFPTEDSRFVPQPYVSTNVTSAGLQYDGSTWGQPYKVPGGVNNVGINVAGGQVIFNFTANTSLIDTLWGADSVTGPYTVIFGKQFSTTAGTFTNTAVTPLKFYYISNQ